MKPLAKTRYGLLLAACLPLQALAGAAVMLEFTPRTPEQMTAFYEARGFHEAMLKPLHQQCFITVRVTNTGDEVVWVDLDTWRFSVDGKPLRRYHRREWLEKWRDMGMRPAHRSTFRWTLMPEKLDYQPGESEGGNIILPRLSGTIRLQATFATGTDGKGPPLHREFDNLYCAEDTP